MLVGWLSYQWSVMKLTNRRIYFYQYKVYNSYKTGYNFQLYFKIIVLENDQLYARPVVKSPPEWCHRICLGSLKQFSEEPLVSLFAFSLSVLHSAFLTVSSFFCSIVCKIISVWAFSWLNWFNSEKANKSGKPSVWVQVEIKSQRITAMPRQKVGIVHGFPIAWGRCPESLIVEENLLEECLLEGNLTRKTLFDQESVSWVDFTPNLFFSLNIHHGRVHLPLDTLTWNAG